MGFFMMIFSCKVHNYLVQSMFHNRNVPQNIFSQFQCLIMLPDQRGQGNFLNKIVSVPLIIKMWIEFK